MDADRLQAIARGINSGPVLRLLLPPEIDASPPVELDGSERQQQAIRVLGLIVVEELRFRADGGPHDAPPGP